MRRFRRFRVPGGGLLRWAVLFGAALLLALKAADLILLGPIAAVAETEARARGISAVNRTLLSSVGRSLKHEDLVQYEKDQQGQIVAYRVNTQLINQVASQAAEEVHKEFRALGADPFQVPLGAMTGSQLLGTTGPRIPVRMIPVGTVAINIREEFKAQGINQTRHRIWLEATAKVQVVLPLLAREVEVSADVPVTETVIVGPVPSGFFGQGEAGGVTIPVKP